MSFHCSVVLSDKNVKFNVSDIGKITKGIFLYLFKILIVAKFVILVENSFSEKTWTKSNSNFLFFKVWNICIHVTK